MADLKEKKFDPECIRQILMKGRCPEEGWLYLKGMAVLGNQNNDGAIRVDKNTDFDGIFYYISWNSLYEISQSHQMTAIVFFQYKKLIPNGSLGVFDRLCSPESVFHFFAMVVKSGFT